MLVGIYEHGYGNWELIKTDPELKLSDKVGCFACCLHWACHGVHRGDVFALLQTQLFVLVTTPKIIINNRKTVTSQECCMLDGKQSCVI